MTRREQQHAEPGLGTRAPQVSNSVSNRVWKQRLNQRSFVTHHYLAAPGAFCPELRAASASTSAPPLGRTLATTGCARDGYSHTTDPKNCSVQEKSKCVRKAEDGALPKPKTWGNGCASPQTPPILAACLSQAGQFLDTCRQPAVWASRVGELGAAAHWRELPGFPAA